MQVLTALGEAQKLGFRHWDLRMTNIMEHHPPSTEAAENPPEAAGSQPVAIVKQLPVSSSPEPQASQMGRSDSAPEVWSAIELTESGAQHAANGEPSLRQKALNGLQDGSRCAVETSGSAVPAEGGVRKDGEAAENTDMQGKQCVWKIIDYGHADFGDKTLQYDGLCIGGPPFDPDDG